MASAEASFCASNLHNKAADKTTPLRDNRVRRRLRARHIADRPTRPVQSLDDRHGVAPILCRRTLRPRHDALSPPQLCHRSVPPLLFQVVSLKSQESLPHARWTG